MKKTSIGMVALAAALFVVSCQKENDAEIVKSAPMTISAESEGLNIADSKADMAYKFDILWRDNDKIIVKKGETAEEFTLTGGAGTTKGTFSRAESTFKKGDEVEAYYPASIVDGENLVWPAEFSPSETVPMYCKKKLSATSGDTFKFASLGSVFQLIFSTTTTSKVLTSIGIEADQAMSGTFTVGEDGNAVISQEGEKKGVTLNLEGLEVKDRTLGVTAKRFNIPIPAGTYTKFTISLNATDGTACKMRKETAEVVYNSVNTLLTSGTFKVYVESVSLNKTEMELTIGNNETLTATVLPDNAVNKEVTWSSSDDSIATVDENGKVTAVSVGEATITVTTTDGGKTATCAVKVLPIAVESVSLDKSSVKLSVNGTVTLVATVLPENATDKSVSWTSNTPGVATVDNGVVNAIAEGTATITVTTTDGSKTATCTITVSNRPDGALSGKFSVGEGKQVYFSQGNLTKDKSGGTSDWKFYKHQYDCATVWDPNLDSHFEWQTEDWGKEFGDGKTWYTLKTEEWQYLLDTRTSAADKVGFATVCGIHGIILLPDAFTDPMKNDGSKAFVPKSSTGWEQNIYTAGDNWDAMELAGSVFLPAAGMRTFNFIYVNEYGFYWSSSPDKDDSDYSWGISFESSEVESRDDVMRTNGLSIRLVTDVK